MNIHKLFTDEEKELENYKMLRISIQEMYDYACEKTKESKLPHQKYKNIDINLKQEVINTITKSSTKKEIKAMLNQLLEYLDNNNIDSYATNIKTLKCRKMRMSLSNVHGIYDAKRNIIKYTTTASLSHEMLHMASHKDCYLNGFKRKHLFTGLNEGYTEVLNRRIFFDEDYNTNAYSKNVILCLLLEQLFDERKQMEDAYFHNDTNYIYNTFCQYGSKEEFYYLNKYLDFFIFTHSDNNELKSTANILNNIILRTNNNKKIEKSNKIIKKYIK